MALTKSGDKKSMTIVSKGLLRVDSTDWENPQDVFCCMRGAALTAFLDALGGKKIVQLDLRILLLLDCMLRVIGEPAMTSPLAFATSRFKDIQRLFYGALGSLRFVDAAQTTRDAWARRFTIMVKELSKVLPVASLAYRRRVDEPVSQDLVEGFEKTPLDMAEVEKLRPFLLKSKTGEQYNVLLSPLVSVLGAEFAASFHEGLKEIALPKAKDAALRDFGTTFANFALYHVESGKELSIEMLRDADAVYVLIVDFLEYHFRKITRRDTPVQEGTLASLQKLWSRYQGFWLKLAEKGIISAPSTAFPEGKPALLADASVGHKRIVATEDGTSSLMTQKLIVPVPLEVTDEEATELLFRQLKLDFSSVQNWLREHLDKLFSNFDYGNLLANSVREVNSPLELSRVFRTMRTSDEAIALAVKHFKVKHAGFIDTTKHVTLPYPDLASRDGPSKTEVSRLLGLPSRRDALALMAYLSSQDGRFSEASMSACTLFDRDGGRINAVEAETGLTISVLKERNAKDGWHQITLNEEAATYVRRWIDVTAPIRAYMCKNNIEGWRNLFVYVGSPLGAPGSFTRSTNLYNSFRVFAIEDRNKLGKLADTVTIPRIRSTRGVLVFMETMDLAAMARELGNTPGTSLRHYLPDVLWEYFAVRWLRIFQNLMIVDATRDTPYMQRALKFKSMAELDAFLRNHALTPRDHDNVTEEEGRINEASGMELMVPASLGLFTALLSVTAAADNAVTEGRILAPYAIYWAEFTKRIRAHIESPKYTDRGIKMMMAEATQNICRSYFDEVVCV